MTDRSSRWNDQEHDGRTTYEEWSSRCSVGLKRKDRSLRVFAASVVTDDSSWHTPAEAAAPPLIQVQGVTVLCRLPPLVLQPPSRLPLRSADGAFRETDEHRCYRVKDVPQLSDV